MHKISGTTIVLTRGDTFKATVSMIKTDGTEYTPVPGDSIRFAMKRSFSDSEVLVERNIPIDTCLLWLEPSDTADLPFGSYVYDIQITYDNGDIDTFIDRATIKLTEEVC